MFLSAGFQLFIWSSAIISKLAWEISYQVWKPL